MPWYVLEDRSLILPTVLALALALFLAASFALKQCRARQHPLAEALVAFRNLLLPAAVVLYLLVYAVGLDSGSHPIRIGQTVFWVLVIWILLSLLKVMVFTRAAGGTWRSRVPSLFLDLLRAAMVLLGSALVFAGVWDRDLGGFLATLGVGSIVLGLALQDTLGNLFAGIALLFEHPFTVGDWIKVGDTVGVVLEINWRAVRIETRSLDMVVVPNSVLGKEKIINLSRPTSRHGICADVRFSYQDPPNKVKRVLVQTALATRGILPEGIVVRTIGYGEFAINYQVRYFIEDYDRLPDIQEEFMTQVWYSMRRNGLSIPFPIRTVQKTEIPYVAPSAVPDDIRAVLQSVALFTPLSDSEMSLLVTDSVLQDFAKGERIIYQGDAESSLFVLKSGSATVTSSKGGEGESEVARLGRGDIFGEMALLTGEARSANVTALEDTEVVVIYKDAMKSLLAKRPALADKLALIVEERRVGLEAVEAEDARHRAAEQLPVEKHESFVARIREFFGL